jgi:hypothetical protein
VLLYDGIMHLSARQHVRERMAHEFADAQLALRGDAARAGVVLMTSTDHDRPEFSHARIRPRVHRFGERDQPGLMGDMRLRA